MFPINQSKDNNTTRERLMRLKDVELTLFLLDLDNNPPGQKIAYVISIVKSSSVDELATLKARVKQINPRPVDSTFLSRLNEAITMRQHILNFERHNYSALQEFLRLDDDVLRMLADLVLELSPDASESLALAVHEGFSTELLAFNNVLQTMTSHGNLSYVRPGILNAFQNHAMALNGFHARQRDMPEASLASPSLVLKDVGSTLYLSSGSKEVKKEQTMSGLRLSSSRDLLFGLASSTFDDAHDDMFKKDPGTSFKPTF